MTALLNAAQHCQADLSYGSKEPVQFAGRHARLKLVQQCIIAALIIAEAVPDLTL